MFDYFRARLHWQLSLPVLVMLVLIGVAGIYGLRSIVDKKLKVEFLQRGELAAHSIQYVVETASTVAGIQRYVAALGAEDDFDFVVVIAGQPPRVIASTERARLGSELSGMADAKANLVLDDVLRGRAPIFEFDQLNSQLSYGSPLLISNIVFDGRPLGKGALLLKMNTDSLAAAASNTFWSLTALFTVSLISLLVLLLALVRRYVLRPQRSLLATVNARQQGQKVMTAVEGENEFAQLGSAFNDMLREADSVDRLKSEFVSTVSHELRTPLTSINGAIRLLIKNVSDKLPDKSLKLLKLADRNVERLSLLINDLLDLEKMANGDMAFDLAPVDLVQLARSAIEINASYAQQHQVVLRLLETPVHAEVFGDADRLQQVFANLLSNAIKFSPPNAEVELAVQRLNGRVKVSIKDYGSGVPEAFRSRIFQRFAQADSSDTREQGGTGLGLSICKTIIEHHDGVIGYNARLREGAEFYFEIPMRSDRE